jgi:hypothetical protein
MVKTVSTYVIISDYDSRPNISSYFVIDIEIISVIPS